jgi:hypothetical protein
MDTTVFDTLTSLLVFDCPKSVLLELPCSGLFAPAISLERHFYCTRCLAFSNFQSTLLWWSVGGKIDAVPQRAIAVHASGCG